MTDPRIVPVLSLVHHTPEEVRMARLVIEWASYQIIHHVDNGEMAGAWLRRRVADHDAAIKEREADRE